MASMCGTCGAHITWARTPSGRPIPLDPEPVVGGNIRVEDPGGACTARIEKPSDNPLYMTHFVTCPDAKEHRRGR
jgi:hypothetical protein